MSKIKVGQVWRCESGRYMSRIHAVLDKMIAIYTWSETEDEDELCGEYGWEPINDHILFHTLISDPDMPWLPLPNGCRLVTQDDRVDHEKPDKYWWYDTSIYPAKWKHCEGIGEWRDEWQYAVHTDHVWEEDKWIDACTLDKDCIKQLQQEVQKLKDAKL